MGRPPAVVIVARHGARLDAADKQWHLTSPTPYDPPLTYGGWTQCRTLGARIAGLLQARETLFDEEANAPRDDAPNGVPDNHERDVRSHHAGKPHSTRRKKHKIFIHSSPFLRCVQSSIAIAAGISQYRGLNESLQQRQTAQDGKTHTTSQNKHLGTSTSTGECATSSGIPATVEEEPESVHEHGPPLGHVPAYIKPRLRIDAFLGEWLSPDYYEFITPPPGSVMMVAGAKADLLRRGEYVEPSDDPSAVASVKGHFPGGWGSLSHKTAESGDLADDLAKISLGSPAQAMSVNHGNTANSSKRSSIESSMSVNSSRGAGYRPPVPRYAISPSDPIPAGYVQHARDACIEVDYQWDSMRAPQNWGDGGEYGEEWSAMHKRFRRGLQGMISWYRLHHESKNQSGGHMRIMHRHTEEEDDEDTDIIIILVTHGAGCNALIGALTNQPVLLDVSMASLTMAVLKEEEPLSSPGSDWSTPTSPGARLRDRPLSAEYNVLLTASTEHLQASSPSPLTLQTRGTFPVQQSPQSSSQTASPRVTARRSRFDDLSNGNSAARASISPFILADRRINNANGVHRSASAVTPPRTSSGGLWSKIEATPKLSGGNMRRTWTVSHVDTDKVATTDGVSVGDATVASPTPLDQQKADLERTPSRGEILQGAGTGEEEAIEDTVSPLGGGLWETNRAGSGEVRERERGFKRRWTVNERV